MTFQARAKFKSDLERLVEQMQAAENQSAPKGYKGEVEAATLEHDVRKFFLDRLLVHLGWKLEQSVVEEARVKADETLFIDYLGVHADTRLPIFILEAKSWESPLISPARSSGKNRSKVDFPQLVADTLNHIKSNSTSPAPAIVDWVKWLIQLRDYVVNLRTQSDHLVTRVAISSGQWIVIFTDPESAFVSAETVPSHTILVFKSDEFVAESDQLYGHLSQDQLALVVPSPLRPSQLLAYVSANTVRSLFRALWVRWEESGSDRFTTFPTILLYPMLLVERTDGALLEVGARSASPLIVPADPSEIARHVKDMEGQSDSLLAMVISQLGCSFVPSEATLFVGFKSTPLRGELGGLRVQANTEKRLLVRPRHDKANEFLMVTGKVAHFITIASGFEHCIGHDWGDCKRAGVQVGTHPVTHASAFDRAYFGSGAVHHCSHQEIHDKRRTHCHLAAFETFFCCRTCAFHDSCWPNSVSTLPCEGTGARPPNTR